MNINKAGEAGISSKISKYLNRQPMYVFCRRYQVIKMVQSKNSNLSLRDIVKDIILAGKFGFSVNDYICFGLYKLDKTEWSTFVTDKERSCFADRLNPAENLELYANKWKAYETYKEYYKRQLCVIDKNDPNALRVFSEFFQVHSCGLAKRIDGSGGHGISLIKNVSDPESSFKKALREAGDRFVLEEMIVQSEDLADIHAESVNTVRVPVIRYDDNVRILPPVFRCGQGNAFVDNASSGGIICGINPETGIIISAADGRGNTFMKHPDTGAKLVGLHMPEWEELLQTAKQITLKVPTNRYYSWDFAHTDTGWVLVEGNYKGQFLWQIPSQKGFRKEANEILKFFGKDLL